MVEKTDPQVDAALSAAAARQAIAERIRKLVRGIQKNADAQIVSIWPKPMPTSPPSRRG